MMTIERQKLIALSLSSIALLTIAQAAIGCGIGILVSGRIQEQRRNPAAIGMLSLAVVATMPAAVSLVAELVSGPRSKIGVRRRLRTIREGAGRHAEEEVF